MIITEKMLADQPIYDGASDHWQQRARKLRARRWKAIARRERNENKPRSIMRAKRGKVYESHQV